MRKFIGNKAFYRMVLAVVIPIVIQNGITNFVGLLDNLMVGQIGTEQMSGVAIANQLMFIFNLAIFGAISGAGIFGAQFYGKNDYEGVRNAFRFKLYICAAICGVTAFVFLVFGKELVSLYLSGDESGTDAAATLEYGVQYLRVMVLGTVPFAFGQIYAGTLRESGETVLPMKAGLVAVLVNLVFNYLLIFGHFGFPKLGATGAAVATVLSRVVEVLIIVVVSHRRTAQFPYFEGLYRTLKIPAALVKSIIIRGMPLFVNELLWAMAMAMLTQCYSVRGLAVVAGLNIAGTVSNLFNVVFISMGNAVGILVGHQLGAGESEKARDTDNKLIFFSVVSCVIIGAIMAAVAPLIPQFYNTNDDVRNLAMQFLLVSAAYMPVGGFLHSCYFTLRAGGKTGVTFLFDCVFIWVISVPLAFCLTRFTGLSIVSIYFICQFADLIKCVIGLILLKKGIWIHNIVSNERFHTKEA